jgi:2-keto-4-pentenoate hydratase
VDVDPRLTVALSVQFRQWRECLNAGAERVGWKLGVGDRERIGSGPVIGYLTSQTQIQTGATYDAGAVVALHADAEIALELGRDIEPDADRETARQAIAGFGAALELVDLDPQADDPQSIVAANVFHRAFVLGTLGRHLRPEAVQGRLLVNGEMCAQAAASHDPSESVLSAALLLASMGERLQAGDCLITGSVVQVPIEPGDHVIADLGVLGSAKATIAPSAAN